MPVVFRECSKNLPWNHPIRWPKRWDAICSNNLLAGRNFSLEDVDFSRIDHINTMIATFIEFEEDTILFYRMLETFIQDESALQELNEIVAEEERHIEKLKSLMHRETLTTSGG